MVADSVGLLTKLNYLVEICKTHFSVVVVALNLITYIISRGSCLKKLITENKPKILIFELSCMKRNLC